MSAHDDELAGRLRHRVTILRQSDDRNELGATEGVWTDFATRWAAVTADGTGDAMVGEATSAAERFRITIRAGVTVLPGDRLHWNGRLLTVRAVIVDPASSDRTTLVTEALR